MTVGKRLRAAREAHGMSIGDIARRTYIQPKFIEAIEEDNLAVVPDSHRRLFVREYAKVIGLSQDEVLGLLDEFAPPPPPVPVVESAAPAVRTFTEPMAPAPSLPQLSEGERKTYGDFLRRMSRGGGIKLGSNNLSRWLIVSAVVLLVGVAGYYMIFGGGSDDPEAAGTPPSADTAGASPTQILSRGSGEGDTAARPDSVAAANGDSLTLEGRATSKIWFAIVMDGKRSETGTLDSGGVKVWRAAKTFKLSLGNAGGLQLTLNDKKLGTLGPMRTSIRNQIIDAGGVKKVLRSPSSTTARRPARQQQQTRVPRIITPTELRTSPPR